MPRDNSPAPDEEEEEEYSVEKVVRLFFGTFLTESKELEGFPKKTFFSEHPLIL